jgi:hypothetical protein
MGHQMKAAIKQMAQDGQSQGASQGTVAA